MNQNIIVGKFGGTSMSSSQAILQSALVVKDKSISVMVVSAVTGTTDSLVEISVAMLSDNKVEALSKVSELEENHRVISRELKVNELTDTSQNNLIEELKSYIKEFSRDDSNSKATDYILSFGERLSSNLALAALDQHGISATLVDARQIIKTNEYFGHAKPQIEIIAEQSREQLLPVIESGQVVVTQGFIGSSNKGETTTLGRGGSDFSAALIAEAVKADQLQIWTDTPGISTADPRIVKNARSIEQMIFQEAAELATAGAKILFPRTITPSRRAKIPIIVGSTFEPSGSKTLISGDTESAPLIRAIALKSNQSLVSLSTVDMAHQPGFLAKVFEVFANHNISVDQVSTSEITISIIVEDSLTGHKKLINDLMLLGEVQVENGLSVISLIGNQVNNAPGLTKDIFVVIESDEKIAIRMICQGASSHNFCFVVEDRHGINIVNRLHDKFIMNSNSG